MVLTIDLIALLYYRFQVLKGMSNDSNYVYLMCHDLSRGIVNVKLFARRIGPMCHARWLTFAGRTLRTHVSARHLNMLGLLSVAQMEIVERVATFIVQSYFKVTIYSLNNPPYQCTYNDCKLEFIG